MMVVSDKHLMRVFNGPQIVSGTMAGEGHHELSRYPYQAYGGLSDGLEGDFILSDVLKLPDRLVRVTCCKVLMLLPSAVLVKLS